MTPAEKTLLKKVVDLLNAAGDAITLHDSGVMFYTKDADGKVTKRYFIKKRNVADADGIEQQVYRARVQKN